MDGAGGTIQTWDHTHWGSPSLEAIRAMHQPSDRFRISPSRYKPGTAFGFAARAGRKYILTGACAITFGELKWELQAGDVVDLPAGKFDFRVLGSESVELISVWELPPEFWGSGRGES